MLPTFHTDRDRHARVARIAGLSGLPLPAFGAPPYGLPSAIRCQAAAMPGKAQRPVQCAPGAHKGATRQVFADAAGWLLSCTHKFPADWQTLIKCVTHTRGAALRSSPVQTRLAAPLAAASGLALAWPLALDFASHTAMNSCEPIDRSLKPKTHRQNRTIPASKSM